MNIIDFLIEKTANSERWEGRSVFEKKNKSYKNSLLEHLFFSYRLGQILGLEEKYCLALLFHDLCEIKYGDVSVGKVNQCTNKIINKIANIAESDNEKIKEKLKAIIYNSKNKDLSDVYGVFNEKIETKQKNEIKTYLKEIGILKSDDKIISVKKIKSQQDKMGELYIFNLILEYSKATQLNLIMESMNLMEHPLVKFVEKAETSFTMISKNRSNYIEKNKSVNWLEYSLREYDNIKEYEKNYVLLKVFLLQQYLIDNGKQNANTYISQQERNILGISNNMEISLPNIDKILLDNNDFYTKMQKFLEERESGQSYAKTKIETVFKKYFNNRECDINKQKKFFGVFDTLYEKVMNNQQLLCEYNQKLDANCITPKVGFYNCNYSRVSLTKIRKIEINKTKDKEKIKSKYCKTSRQNLYLNSL